MGLLGVAVYPYYEDKLLVPIPTGNEMMGIHLCFNTEFTISHPSLKEEWQDFKAFHLSVKLGCELWECRAIVVLYLHFLSIKRSIFSPLKVTDVKKFAQLKHGISLGKSEIIPL